MDNFTFRCDCQKDYNVHEMNGIYFQPDMLDFFIKVIIWVLFAVILTLNISLFKLLSWKQIIQLFVFMNKLLII